MSISTEHMDGRLFRRKVVDGILAGTVKPHEKPVQNEQAQQAI